MHYLVRQNTCQLLTNVCQDRRSDRYAAKRLAARLDPMYSECDRVVALGMAASVNIAVQVSVKLLTVPFVQFRVSLLVASCSEVARSAGL